MTKLMGALMLVCYFVALVAGLMWYLTYRQLSVERMAHLSRTEAEGYQVISPPSAEEIRQLLEREKALQAQIEVLTGELGAKREEYQELKPQVVRLRKELDNLTLMKNANEEGERLARLFGAMKPAEVAETLAALEDEVLPIVVEYALPYMDDKTLARVMDSVTKAEVPETRALAPKIVSIIGTSLFDMGLEHQSDLDAARLSTTLREEFESNGVFLSQEAQLRIEKQGARWRLEDIERTYGIRKEKGRIGVYLKTLS